MPGKIKHKIIYCHLCGNKLFPDSLLKLDGMPKAAQYYPEKQEFAKDKGIILNIYQCSICGLVQHKNKPVEYYKKVITAATLSESSRLSRLNQMKEFVDRFLLHGKEVLEVGSGKGEMLDVLKEAGVNATGIEAGKESVKIAGKLGRKMINGYIGGAGKIKGGLFDAFISLNYLEHLPEPGNIIRNIYNNTTPSAFGYVTVPNLEYLVKTKSFYEFVVDHISYFTVKTLTYLFESNGFDVLECKIINNDNDIAAVVKKKKPLDFSGQYTEVEKLIKDLKRIITDYKSRGKKVAVWGAGHRTIALLVLSKADNIEYIIDSAKFKHGRYIPILHVKIVPPEYLREKKVDLVIVMVPGLYPAEVLKTLSSMNLGLDIAMLSNNKIKFT